MTDGPSGRELKRRREALGLTQDEAARAVGMTALTLSRWERGVGSPNPHALDALLRYYSDDRRIGEGTSRGDVPRETPSEGARAATMVAGLLRQIADLVELGTGGVVTPAPPPRRALDDVPPDVEHEEDVTPSHQRRQRRNSGGKKA